MRAGASLNGNLPPLDYSFAGERSSKWSLVRREKTILAFGASPADDGSATMTDATVVMEDFLETPPEPFDRGETIASIAELPAI